MDSDSNDKDGHEDKEDDCMHQNGDAAGEHVPKLHDPRPRRQLKQQPRRQQDEQNHRDDHRTPISHVS